MVLGLTDAPTVNAMADDVVVVPRQTLTAATTRRCRFAWGARPAIKSGGSGQQKDLFLAIFSCMRVAGFIRQIIAHLRRQLITSRLSQFPNIRAPHLPQQRQLLMSVTESA